MEVLYTEPKYLAYCCYYFRGLLEIASFVVWVVVCWSLYQLLSPALTAISLPLSFHLPQANLITSLLVHLGSLQSILLSKDSWFINWFDHLCSGLSDCGIILSSLFDYTSFNNGIRQLVSGPFAVTLPQLLLDAVLIGCLFHIISAITFGWCYIWLRFSAVSHRRHRAIPDLACLISTTLNSQQSPFSFRNGLMIIFGIPYQATIGVFLRLLWVSLLPIVYFIFYGPSPTSTYYLRAIDFRSRESLLQTLIPQIRHMPFNGAALHSTIVRVSAHTGWSDRQAFISARSQVAKFTSVWDFLAWFTTWELLAESHVCFSQLARQQALLLRKPVRSYPDLCSLLSTLDEMPFLYQHFPKVFRQLLYQGSLSRSPARAPLKALFDRSVNSFQFFAALDAALWDLTPRLRFKPKLRPNRRHHLRIGCISFHHGLLPSYSSSLATVPSFLEVTVACSTLALTAWIRPYLVLNFDLSTFLTSQFFTSISHYIIVSFIKLLMGCLTFMGFVIKTSITLANSFTHMAAFNFTTFNEIFTRFSTSITFLQGFFQLGFPQQFTLLLEYWYLFIGISSKIFSGFTFLSVFFSQKSTSVSTLPGFSEVTLSLPSFRDFSTYPGFSLPIVSNLTLPELLPSPIWNSSNRGFINSVFQYIAVPSLVSKLGGDVR